MSNRADAKVQAQQKTLSGSSPRSNLLQRSCACGQHTIAGGECEACRKTREGTMQRAAVSSAPVHAVLPVVHGVLSSPGQPLAAGTRTFMEPRFGHDFSQIPVYSPHPPVLQRKLAINKPGDQCEQEADQVADQVMTMPAHHSVSGVLPSIQRFSGQSNGQMDVASASVDHALASPGRPLEPTLRQDMEQRFGHDFSRVRVHSNDTAEQSARDVNAHAYTVGHEIVFGAGQFAPGTHEGRRLIAHELTHVVQQSASEGILLDQGNEKHSLTALGTGRSSVPLFLQRAPKGAVRAKSFKCTGVELVGTRITFYGNDGPISATAKPIDIPPGTYKVSYRGGSLKIDVPGGLILTYSWDVRGSQQQIKAFEKKLMGYIESMTEPVTLTVRGTPTRSSGVSESAAEPGETGTGDSGGERDVHAPEGRSGKQQEKSGTGTTGPGTERQPSGTGGEQGGAGEKADPEYAAKLKALLDGIETKPLDPETERQLKSILDKLSLDDIALFKQFAVKNPGGDMEGFLRSLRLFVSTKDVYQKQKPPEAQAPDESQKILADALKQYRDDMSQDEKEALARATIRGLSNEQLKNISAQQIAEGIVRVDKQLKGMADEMDKGVNDLIQGTGWEKVAGGARFVKGASSFWGFLALAAIVASAFIPGLNVAVLAANAFAAGIVAYAAANIQLEAETQAASRAKSPQDFQKRVINATAARNEVIIQSVVLALPLAGKFIGKLPLPAAMNRVSTVLNTAGKMLKQTSGKAFGSVKASVLEALSSARADMQPYLIQFRATIGSIAGRIRGASGAEFLKEFKSTPELQELVSDETLKAMEHLKADELAVAKKGVLEQLDNAPAVAEETIKSMQAQMADLEKKVQVANTAQDLQKVLGEGTKTSEPEQVAKQAGTQAVENVVQSRVKKISNLSVADVKKDTISLLQDVQKLPNTNPNKQSVLNELKEILKKTQELEKKQGKADISKELEDISRRHEELDDLVADAIAKMNESRRPQVAPQQKVAPPPQKGTPPSASPGKQPPQKQLTSKPTGTPTQSWADLEQSAEASARRRPTGTYGSQSARSGSREVIIVEGEVGPPVADEKLVAKARSSKPTLPGEHATHPVGAQLGENLPEAIVSGPASQLNLSVLRRVEDATRATFNEAIEHGATVETRTVLNVEHRFIRGEEVPVLVGVKRQAWVRVPGSDKSITFIDFEARVDPVSRQVTIVRDSVLRPPPA